MSQAQNICEGDDGKYFATRAAGLSAYDTMRVTWLVIGVNLAIAVARLSLYYNIEALPGSTRFGVFGLLALVLLWNGTRCLTHYQALF